MGAIHEAARTNDVVALKALIQQSPSLMATYDSDGAMPIHVAAKRGNVEALLLLLGAGADINASTKLNLGFVTDEDSGVTPLYWAALYGQLEVANVLVARGANVNSVAFGDATPLSAARKKGYQQIAKLLSDHGASSSAPTASKASGAGCGVMLMVALLLAYAINLAVK